MSDQIYVDPEGISSAAALISGHSQSLRGAAGSAGAALGGVPGAAADADAAATIQEYAQLVSTGLNHFADLLQAHASALRGSISAYAGADAASAAEMT